MTAIDCATALELAPDLALGLADGDERASVLDHLATCPSCRRELEALSTTTDALLLAAPSAEPPDGFETRVLTAIGSPTAGIGLPTGRRPVGTTSPRVHRLAVVGVAAAILVVVALLGAGIWRFVDTGRSPATGPGLEALGGEALRVGSLAPAGGPPAGQVFAYEGRPSWLLVTTNGTLPAGTYRVECEYDVGDSFDAGTLTVDGSNSSTWATDVPVPLDQLTRVRLVPVGSPDGTAAGAEAEVGPA